MFYYYQDSQFKNLCVLTVAVNNEIERMGSENYVANVAIESMIRGYNGDPLGTVLGEIDKRAWLEQCKADLKSRFRRELGLLLLPQLIGFLTFCYILFALFRSWRLAKKQCLTS